MRHSVDEWKSLAMPNGVSERQLNEWQAQVIIDAVADIVELSTERNGYLKLSTVQADKIGRLCTERGRLRAALKELLFNVEHGNGWAAWEKSKEKARAAAETQAPKDGHDVSRD